jgi:hypothetical protein
MNTLSPFKKKIFKQLRETKNDSEPQKNGRKTSKVVILGDFLLKFAGKACTRKGYDVCCYPRSRLEALRHQVERFIRKKLLN